MSYTHDILVKAELQPFEYSISRVTRASKLREIVHHFANRNGCHGSAFDDLRILCSKEQRENVLVHQSAILELIRSNLRAFFLHQLVCSKLPEFWPESDHLLMRLQSAQLIQSGGINSLLLEMDTAFRNWRFKAGLGTKNQCISRLKGRRTFSLDFQRMIVNISRFQIKEVNRCVKNIASKIPLRTICSSTCNGNQMYVQFWPKMIKSIVNCPTKELLKHIWMSCPVV